MKEQIPLPAPLSRTLQGKTREPNTASVTHVLQAYKNGISQRQEVDEDELLQGKFESAQRDELEDDELLQGKFKTVQREELEDDELLQGKFETAQRDELEDDELLQGKFETVQRDELDDDELLQGKFEPTQRQEAPNNTGLPDNLKAGVEQLSGLDMSDVKVHYNSSKPAKVQAYAYTQGTDIHVAPGQEKHLGHEAWHVAQQKQGRVQPTTTVGGMQVNDNAGLENEADMMGGKAVQMKQEENISQVFGNDIEQKKSNVKQGFGFVDNRCEAITQRMLKDKCNSKLSENMPIQRTIDEDLVSKLKQKNVKFELNDLLFTVAAASGIKTTADVVFLEKGNENAGYTHIEKHVTDFIGYGITKEKLLDFLESTVSKEPDSTKSGNKGGTLASYLVNLGKDNFNFNFNFNVVIAENGFIITAFPDAEIAENYYNKVKGDPFLGGLAGYMANK